jgi:hypothetical protein
MIREESAATAPLLVRGHLKQILPFSKTRLRGREADAAARTRKR